MHIFSNNFFWSSVRRRCFISNHLSIISLKSDVLSVGTLMKLEVSLIVDCKIM